MTGVVIVCLLLDKHLSAALREMYDTNQAVLDEIESLFKKMTRARFKRET